MSLRTNTWGDPTVQTDGLAINNTPSQNLRTNTETNQYYVVKEGNVEVSAKYTLVEQATAELGKLLLESPRNLRIAVVDRSGNELLRG